mmetsp:Transcript_107099/g.276915  ORF Transcript_107099/g.276915 Transcript_107099/m.276915 type:complete len:219 (+) Transcript_107099:328-984(+)
MCHLLLQARIDGTLALLKCPQELRVLLPALVLVRLEVRYEPAEVFAERNRLHPQLRRDLAAELLDAPLNRRAALAEGLDRAGQLLKALQDAPLHSADHVFQEPLHRDQNAPCGFLPLPRLFGQGSLQPGQRGQRVAQAMLLNFAASAGIILHPLIEFHKRGTQVQKFASQALFLGIGHGHGFPMWPSSSGPKLKRTDGRLMGCPSIGGQGRQASGRRS